MDVRSKSVHYSVLATVKEVSEHADLHGYR